MRILGKLVTVVGLGLLAVVVALLPGLLVDDVVYSGWGLALLFLAPFIGTFIGGWLVSRRSGPGGKVGWILGGGFGLGLLPFFALVLVLAANFAP